MEFVVPYESGARRITSNLGSDLFCPLWLVGLAHLEWRARVARSCCIGRRWSVGCSPLARYLLSSCGVWWEVFSSLAETPPVVNMEVETCSHCPARLSLSYLGWTTCLPGRLFTDLGKGKAAGGNACPGQRCSPTAIAVSRGLPLSTSVILMGSGTTTFQDLVRKSVRGCCGASARVLCPGCGQRVLFVASTLAVPSVTTKVSNECQRRRKSAHQRSLSRLEAIPLVGPHSLRFHQ